MQTRLIALIAALAIFTGCGDDEREQAAAPAPLTVYAAASLREALPAVMRARYSFAGSGALQRQIERGAPADVFASASPEEAQALYAAGRCERPVTFASNRLVLLTPSDGEVRSLAELSRGGRRLAVGAEGVPVGAYTRAVLRRLGRMSILRVNVVSHEPDVKGVVSKVALGSADAGFAYVTDGRAAGARVRAIAIPASAQPPVRYQACVVRRPGAETAAAREHVAELSSARGRAMLARFGFGVPPRG